MKFTQHILNPFKIRLLFFLKKFFVPNWLFFVLGKDEPVAPTLHIKPKDPKTFVTPSPGAYNPVSGGGKFIYVRMFKFTNIVLY